jgi:hypothetical protein
LIQKRFYAIDPFSPLMTCPWAIVQVWALDRGRCSLIHYLNDEDTEGFFRTANGVLFCVDGSTTNEKLRSTMILVSSASRFPDCDRPTAFDLCNDPGIWIGTHLKFYQIVAKVSRISFFLNVILCRCSRTAVMRVLTTENRRSFFEIIFLCRGIVWSDVAMIVLHDQFQKFSGSISIFLTLSKP